MNIFQFLRLLFKGPTPQQMAAQLRKPQGMMARKLAERMNDANRAMYAGVWKALDLGDGMQVLEIGFGNGNYFRELLGQAKELKLHGVDFSKDMVAEAIVRNKDLIANGNLQVVQATSDNMPFADALFDRIFCINVIYFWDDPSAHLREVRRVLKPGGTFTAVFRTRAAMEKMPFTQFGFAMYEKEDWQAVLQANGFAVANSDVLREGAIEFEGKTYSPESLVMTAVAN